MTGITTPFEDIRPIRKQRLIDLVQAAGCEVSDWANCKGGLAKAAANPRYCYEWCFADGKSLIVNIWFENLAEQEGHIVQYLNMRERANLELGPRKSRALKFDRCVREAYDSASNLRAIILDRQTKGKGNVELRLLDPVPWYVSSYSNSNGVFTLTRGPRSDEFGNNYDPALQEYHEGQVLLRMVRHRKRESTARSAKIEEALLSNNGRLVCEVVGCSFDFAATYGELGSGYAHAHHKIPLHTLPEKGGKVLLSDFAVVCANCHAMIHRGGKCRNMKDIIPAENAIVH